MPLVRALRSARPAGGRAASCARSPPSRSSVGVGAVVRPGRLTGACVTASYLAFTAFVALALRRGGVLAPAAASAGRTPRPPARTSLVTAAFAAGCRCARAGPAGAGAWSALPVSARSWSALVALAALVGLLAWLVMAVLPTASRPPSAAAPGRV